MCEDVAILNILSGSGTARVNLDDIRVLVDGGESETLELKRSTGQRTDAVRTVSAMLNGRGGFVVFGVSPDGLIVGQDVSEKTHEDLHHELRKIEPPAFPLIETIPLPSGLSVIVVSVTGSMGTELYTFDGRPYH
jgi:ATP-dependent DNA helicase RecG